MFTTKLSRVVVIRHVPGYKIAYRAKLASFNKNAPIVILKSIIVKYYKIKYNSIIVTEKYTQLTLYAF